MAIRAALLSIAIDGRFSDPGMAFDLYRDRSELVHGARTAADEKAFQRTLSVAEEALQNYIAIANRKIEIRHHKRLLNFLADDETLSGLTQWIEEYGPWGEQDLLSAIKGMTKPASKQQPVRVSSSVE